MATEATIFLVDDDQAVRKALSWLFGSVDLPVMAFASGQEFLEGYTPGDPGCILLDVRMPGMSGLDLQAELSGHGIDLPIIFITGHGDVEMAVRAMKAGAVDFISKPFDDQIILDTVQKALKLDADMHRSRAAKDDINERLDSLTPRERVVLEKVIAGDPNKSIAADINRSEKTVEVHRRKIMEKMQAKSVAALVTMVVTADHT